MSVMNSEKLNLQTTWNTELPYEVLLGLKKQVPVVMEMASVPAKRAYNEINKQSRKLDGFFAWAKKQGKVMLKRANDKLAAVNPSDVMTVFTDKTILILREYQRKVEIVLDAVVKFLKETTFQLPGYEQRLSGLEVYQKFTAFVADVSEEAAEKIPQYFASMFEGVLNYFQAIKFIHPVSGEIVTGKEVLENLIVALRKIQSQVIDTVRNVQLEDIIRKLSAFMQYTVEQSERFLQNLNSENVEKLFAYMTAVYNDAMNSRVLADIVEQVEAVQIAVMKYLKVVLAKLQSFVTDMSSEELRTDIQSRIDGMVKRINKVHNNVTRTLKEKTKTVEQYVRVGDRQIEIDIPLPFLTRSN